MRDNSSVVNGVTAVISYDYFVGLLGYLRKKLIFGFIRKCWHHGYRKIEKGQKKLISRIKF
jgi:hypothetical protein